MLTSELQKRSDFREHSSPHLLVQNGQATTVNASRPRTYIKEVLLKPEIWPGFKHVMGQIDEGFSVAQRAGGALPWADAAAFRRYFHEVLLPPTRAHRSSMRQDLEAGRRTEFDAIGGAIVRAGERVGVPTPVNAMLVDQVHAAERLRDFRMGGASV